MSGSWMTVVEQMLADTPKPAVASPAVQHCVKALYRLLGVAMIPGNLRNRAERRRIQSHTLATPKLAPVVDHDDIARACPWFSHS